MSVSLHMALLLFHTNYNAYNVVYMLISLISITSPGLHLPVSEIAIYIAWGLLFVDLHCLLHSP